MKWVDQWQPVTEALEYIDHSKIPAIARGICPPSHSYVHLRPLILNLWFQER